ncbi:hypothetical protein GCM10027277_20980 [Pseudoduganella ginsengisoli]|uniref:hypothetical protein n=1 Tax=Pseudoduganella ginsengisoli TaxID=1462440 RepID=UPI001E5C20EE|nr:hypothetical protein [Pseudoduganella ginsengisoli]
MAARKNSSTSAAIAGTLAGLLAAGLLGYYLYWNKQPETKERPAPMAAALADAMQASVAAQAATQTAPVHKGALSREQAVATLMALPELQAWSKQIEKASGGKAHGAIIEYDNQLREHDGKRYYQLSFIENSDDTAQRWESFLVSLTDGDILVDDDIDGTVLSLAQWRETKKPLQRSGPGT